MAAPWTRRDQTRLNPHTAVRDDKVGGLRKKWKITPCGIWCWIRWQYISSLWYLGGNLVLGEIKGVRLWFSVCVLLEIIGPLNTGLSGSGESGKKGKSQRLPASDPHHRSFTDIIPNSTEGEPHGPYKPWPDYTDWDLRRTNGAWPDYGIWDSPVVRLPLVDPLCKWCHVASSLLVSSMEDTNSKKILL